MLSREDHECWPREYEAQPSPTRQQDARTRDRMSPSNNAKWGTLMRTDAAA